MSWGYVHLLLNHVPVIGTILGLLLMLVAFVRKSEELKQEEGAWKSAGDSNISLVSDHWGPPGLDLQPRWAGSTYRDQLRR